VTPRLVVRDAIVMVTDESVDAEAPARSPESLDSMVSAMQLPTLR